MRRICFSGWVIHTSPDTCYYFTALWGGFMGWWGVCWCLQIKLRYAVLLILLERIEDEKRLLTLWSIFRFAGSFGGKGLGL